MKLQFIAFVQLYSKISPHLIVFPTIHMWSICKGWGSKFEHISIHHAIRISGSWWQVVKATLE